MAKAPEFNFVEFTRDKQATIGFDAEKSDLKKIMETMKKFGAIAGGVSCAWFDQRDRISVDCKIKGVSTVFYDKPDVLIELERRFDTLKEKDIGQLRLLGDNKLGIVDSLLIGINNISIDSNFPPAASYRQALIEGEEPTFTLGDSIDSSFMNCGITIGKDKDKEGNEGIETEVSIFCEPSKQGVKLNIDELEVTPFSKRLSLI